MAPVGTDDQIGADLTLALRSHGLDADHPSRLLDQPHGLRPHPEREGRVPLRLGCEEIQEVPLRHEREELAVGRQVPEVRHGDSHLAHLGAELQHFLVRQREKVREQSELVHHLEGRGMDGVAAEVAQEVGVLLENQHVHAGAGQKEPEHHAGRPAAGDAAPVPCLGLHRAGVQMMDLPASTISVAPVM
jgi:hypothetical protein